MSDTSAPKSAKSATAKAAKAFDAPFEAFNMMQPSFEIPASLRDMAEKTVEGTKEAYAKMKSAADEATSAMEDSYETTRSGMLALSYKSLDAAKVHSDATFAFARDFFGVRTFAEALSLQTNFARQQMETLMTQAKDFQEFSKKFATDASAPMKAGVEKVMSATKLN